MAAYTSPPISVSSFRDADRVELVFRGVEQAGPSFEGRVFLNRPNADEATATTSEAGYAGSFHVYGYGEHPPPGLAEEKRSLGPDGPPAAPIEKRLPLDQAALRGALERSGELTVTVVPVPADEGGAPPGRPFETVEVVFGRD
jgi:hypothetical protein